MRASRPGRAQGSRRQYRPCAGHTNNTEALETLPRSRASGTVRLSPGPVRLAGAPNGAPWRPAEGTLRHSLCSHPPASPHRSAMGNQKPPSPAPRAHPHRVAPRPAAQPDAPARVGSVPAPVRRVSRGAQAAPAPEHLLFCLGSLPQTSGLGVGADEVARRPLCQTFPSRWRHNPIVRPRLRLR